MPPLRIGTLGAARITPAALVSPASHIDSVTITAVAARDPERAQRFADRHHIPTVHPDYRALIDDPEIDAVYNPLPNSLHATWTIAALEAGKHVLCEKPLTSNASEAAEVARAAEASGGVLMEAFHWRYHPMAGRMIAIARSGELGELRSAEAWVCFPLLAPRNIRYRYELGGGAMMDAGCYAVHILRTLVGTEPSVDSARAKLSSPRVDRAMTAQLSFPGGPTGRLTCSMLSTHLLGVGARLVGETATMSVRNPLQPRLGGRIKVTTSSGSRTERFGGPSTYHHQLEAFVAATSGSTSAVTGPAGPHAPITGPSDSVANMAVIDAAYRTAGLPLRGT